MSRHVVIPNLKYMLYMQHVCSHTKTTGKKHSNVLQRFLWKVKLWIILFISFGFFPYFPNSLTKIIIYVLII